MSTRFGNNPGYALITNMNSVKIKRPEKIIPAKYLFGYPPIKHNKMTIQNKIAVVEKLAGKINTNIDKIGNHKGIIELPKRIS